MSEKRTMVVEFGPCGFGYTKSPIREVRVGIIKISTISGSLSELLEKTNRSLGDAVCELRRQK
jgi:hypothetical protein